MELAPLLIVLGVAVIAVAFVVRPLLEGRGREPDARERRLSALRAEQDQTLALLHELDMDFTMGKIEPEDYQAQRAARMTRAADILREIDELAPPAAPAAAAAAPQGDLEARVAEMRRRAAGFCGRCGHPLVLGDRFCTRCGEAVPGASG